MRVYGNSCESYEIDFAVRNIDSDPIIELMYTIGYILPSGISTDTDEIIWAETEENAHISINEDKRGELFFYTLDGHGNPLDQIGFVIDNSIPFMRLKQHALLIRENPDLYCASIDDLIIMKQNRIEKGFGSEADKVDLDFLLKKKSSQWKYWHKKTLP